MRFVILGAGGVGSVIGARLHQAGSDVTLIARGDHLAALQARGLELRDPDGTARLAIEAVGDPGAAEIAADDIVVLATKTQQSEAALASLAAVAPAEVAVVCAQNGVENERLALRRFANTYAMSVMVPATFLEPGVVECSLAPRSGILDLGRYPEGRDETAAAVAEALRAAGFDSRSLERVMGRKYLKLLSNLGNAIEAASGTRLGDPAAAEVFASARAEALACYAAAGIEVADADEDQERRRALGRPRPVGGTERRGGSSWQSLSRATGNIEADWLNGEIVLLGRQHGIPTPVNALLQATANRMAASGMAPGTVPAEELLAQL